MAFLTSLQYNAQRNNHGADSKPPLSFMYTAFLFDEEN